MMTRLSILSGLLLIKYTVFLPNMESPVPLVVLSTLMIACPLLSTKVRFALRAADWETKWTFPTFLSMTLSLYLNPLKLMTRT